eukprot:2272528-Rhodomonas_salina.1
MMISDDDDDDDAGCDGDSAGAAGAGAGAGDDDAGADELGVAQSKNFAFKCHRDQTTQDVYAVNSIVFHPQHGTFCT